MLTSRRVFKLNVCSRLKTDSADDKVVCSWSVLVKTDLLQICCRSARFVRGGLIDYMPIDDGCRSLYEFVNARKSCIWTVDWHKGWCVRSSPLMLFFLFFNITCAVMRTLWWGSHTSFKFSLQVHDFHMSTSYNNYLLYCAVNKILRLYQ